MSDSALPENLEEWPRDPFALFGVSHAISQRDLKRIYTRLIRQFKPERMPEHFRRIREAYETLLQFAAWNDARNLEAESARESEADHSLEPLSEVSEGASSPNGNGPVEEFKTPGQDSTTEAFDSAALSNRIRFTEDSCEQSWRQAIKGELEVAYRSLQNQVNRQPGKPTTYIQLYWLLSARRELDPVRTPQAWILQGLASCPQYGQLLELWTEGLLEDPEQALSPGFVELIDRSKGSFLAELLERRWQAIARMQRWDLASVDLEMYGQKVCRDDEAAWLRLLLSLASKSFGAHPQDTDAIVRLCETRIKELHHLGLAHGEMFDRAEYLGHLAREAWGASLVNWDRGKLTRSSPISPETVLRVVHLFVAGGVEELPDAVEPLLAGVCQQPSEGMRVLDQLASRTPGSFVEFRRALEWLSWTYARRELLTHSGEAAGILARRLIFQFDGNYASIRSLILRYCCAEAIAPEYLCEILHEPDINLGQIAERIAADVSLRLTYRMYRLGWSI